jgi:serine/threonine-protein kinase
MTAARGLSGQETQHEGKYRVLVELGQGGTAIVYLAVARGPSGFNKLVVLKALKKNLANDPEFRNMFLNEARLAARLNHPNIVQTNEVAEDEGVPVIVMEYLEGQPLSNLLIRGRNGPLSLAAHLRIITDSLAGLHYAHEVNDFDGTPLGVVHRDMTPHNVFVTFEGQVKVLDFGIAKLGTSMIETQAGVIKGKLRYMPPEQISGESIDRRADIYACGVMLWEAAAGERLWKSQSDATIMNRVLNGEIPSPREKRPEVPEELERICMKALAADRNNRYPTAADLETDLENFLGSLGVEGRVTARQIGKLVDKLFEDVRVRTKALVEAQLSKVASLSWAEYQASQALVQAPTMTFSNSTAGSTISDSVDQMKRVRARRFAYLPWVGGAAVMLLFLVIWKGFAKEPSPTPVALPPSAAPTESPNENRGANKVSLRLSASPSEAKLYFDNDQLPSNPYTGSMPADGNQHTVRAEAQGYSSSSTVFILDRDADIVLALERSKSGPSNNNVAVGGRVQSRPRSGPAPGPVTAAPPAPAPAPAPPAVPTVKADCSPPYFVDQKGIKRYKPECM